MKEYLKILWCLTFGCWDKKAIYVRVATFAIAAGLFFTSITVTAVVIGLFALLLTQLFNIQISVTILVSAITYYLLLWLVINLVLAAYQKKYNFLK